MVFLKTKKLATSVALFCVSLYASVSQANDILTSTPVTYMLASQLTKGLPIVTRYLPPKRYGIERVANWYAQKGKIAAIKAGKEARVAITLSAIWEDDPTYIYARQGNIALIEIDATQALTPEAKAVAVSLLNNGKASKYAWLNPDNLTRMLAIVGDDLKRVYPAYQMQIENNQRVLVGKIQALKNQQQEALFAREIEAVVLVSEALEDFAAGLQLFVVDSQYKAPLEWTVSDKQALQAMFSDDDSLWLLTDKAPSKTLLEIVAAERIVEIDAIDRWGAKGIDPDNPLSRWRF